jgi:hypothetical protein
MRGNSILLALVACILSIVICQSAYAYSYDNAIKLLPSNYVAPKMDCEPDGQTCVLLAYDNSTGRLQVFNTFTRFTHESYPLVANRTLVTDSNLGKLIALNPASAIPYDVEYISESSTFIIVGIYQLGKVTSYNIHNGVLATIYNLGTQKFTFFYDAVRRYMFIDPQAGTKDFREEPYALGAYYSGDSSQYQNWTRVDYIGGILFGNLGDQQKTHYILYGYNSTTGKGVFSNTSDYYIGGIGRYQGIYERENSLSSYKIFMHNSTHVLQYDLASNQTIPFFKFNGNVIISQSLWQNPTVINDKVIIFQNSSGIWRYNTWTSSFEATPNEYNESLTTSVTQDYFFFWNVNNFRYPKVACSENLESCAMLVYDTGVLSWNGAGLKLYYTTNPLSPNWQRIYKFSDIAPVDMPTIFAVYPPPYDIRYNSASGKFRIVAGEHLYEWNGIGNPTTTMTYSLLYSHGQNSGLGFADEEGDVVIAMIHTGSIGGSPTYPRGNLVTTAWNSQTPITTLWTCSPTPVTGEGCASPVPAGTVNYESGNLKYEIQYYKWNFDAPATWFAIGYNSTSNLNMVNDHDYTQPYQYYYPEEGLAFFERDAGDTPNDYGKGIYYAGHLAPNGID